MPHGTPDWGLVGPKRTTYGLDDLGEHAVRLGSSHLWDRRGDVMVQDTFEHGLGQAQIGLSGGNADVALEGGHAWHGAFCAKLTTGDDDDRHAELAYRHGLPVSSGVGIEFTFTIPTPEPEPEATLLYWEWYVWWQQPGRYRYGGVRYDVRNSVLEYQNAGGGWTPFPDRMLLPRSPTIWHTGKLVVDYIDRYYVRFILNDQSWPLAGLPIYEYGVGGLPCVAFIARLHGQKDENQIGYVDNVVITQNEP